MALLEYPRPLLQQWKHGLNRTTKQKCIEEWSKMENLPQDVEFGENFTLEDYADIVSEASHQIYWLGPGIDVPIILAYVVVIALGFVSNGLICYVVLSKKKLRTVRNLLIVNLSVSDMMICLFCTPFTLLKLLVKQWPLGDGMCRLVPWLQAVNVFASTLTITAIALDRYQRIIYPTTVRENSRKWIAVVCILGIWFVSSLIGLPLMVRSKVVKREYMHCITFFQCTEEWPSSAGRLAYASAVMVLQFALPIIVLFIIHWRICSFLKCRIKCNPATPMEMARAMKDAKRHRKNSTLLMAIAVMFALCWFPLTLLNFLADFNYRFFMFRNFLLTFSIAHLIALTSACLNPIVYGWFNSNFRLEFNRLCRRWRVFGSKEDQDDDEELEKRKLITIPQQIVYTRRMSYKAIQTEVQPVFNHASTQSDILNHACDSPR